MDRGDRRLARLAAFDELERVIGAESREVGREVPSAAAHALIENAAGEQEHEQHQRAVEIGVALMGDRLDERERKRENDAERDRHVHVERAAFQRACGADEERHAGVSRARQRDQGGEPVKEVARRGVRVGVGARPERDREQHHVHRRESRDAEAAQELRLSRLFDAVDRGRRERMGGIAQGLEALENRRRLERALVPLDGDALAREIDSRAAHARLLAEALLDRADAGAAMDAFDDQVHRRDAVERTAHEQRQILRGGHCGSAPRAAAAMTNLFSLRNMRSGPRLASRISVHWPGRTGVATPA